MAKIIFFDIDDTLSRDGKILSHHLEILSALAKTEVKLVIATGRGRAMLPRDVLALLSEGVFDAIICMNGQYNFRLQASVERNQTQTDDIISHYPLSVEQCEAMVQIGSSENLLYKFDAVDQIAWGQHSEYSDYTSDKPIFTVDPEIFLTRDVYQCSIFFADKTSEPKLDPQLASPIDHLGLRIVYWHSNGGDILPQDASKAQGILDVCEFFKVDIKDTMAFGDGLNDIEMFKLVGTSIAVGNAQPELIAVADYVTETIEDNGIGLALAKYSLL